MEATAIARDPPAVSIRGLNKRYGDNLVLRGIDLEIAQGEVVSIIGPSGSGKSTLLSCINFIEPYDEGDVRVDGELVGYEYRMGGRMLATEERLNRLRTKVGFVFQQFNLFPHLTVLRNITVGLVHVRKMPQDRAVALARDQLERVGLLDKQNAYPSELSGGQQQRVAIARGLAMEPAVLLLDEITSALDPELVGEVLGVIQQLATSGLTMVVVTHEMKFARDVSTRVVFMESGAIVEQGTPAQIFEAPVTDRLRQFLGRFSS